MPKVFSATKDKLLELLGPSELETLSKNNTKILTWSCGCEFHEVGRIDGTGVFFPCGDHCSKPGVLQEIRQLKGDTKMTKWTTEKPTEDGLYWLRERREPVTIVRVWYWSPDYDAQVSRFDEDWSTPLPCVDGLWYGPITPPPGWEDTGDD